MDPSISLFRTYSVFGSAPTCGFFFSIVIPLAFYRLLILRGIKLIAGFVVIGVLLLALTVTFSRSAFISIPTSIVMMVFFLPSRKLKFSLLGCIAAISIFALLIVTIGNVPLFGRFLNSDVMTINNRTYLWQAILDHFDPTQLLGNGLNASDVLLARLQVGYGGVISTGTQNLYIAALYDHGIIGLGLLLVVLTTLFISIIKGLRGASGNRRMLFATALAVFVSMFLQSFESTDIWISSVGIYFWLIMALPFVYHWLPQPAQVETIENDITEEMTRPELVAVRPMYNWYEKEYDPRFDAHISQQR